MAVVRAPGEPFNRLGERLRAGALAGALFLLAWGACAYAATAWLPEDPYDYTLFTLDFLEGFLLLGALGALLTAAAVVRGKNGWPTWRTPFVIFFLANAALATLILANAFGQGAMRQPDPLFLAGLTGVLCLAALLLAWQEYLLRKC